jgi:hypothetical protein
MLKASSFIWWIYICLAPVYWLPHIPFDLFYLAKSVLIAAGTISAFFCGLTNSHVRYAHKLVGLTGFLLLLLSITPGLILGQPQDGVKIAMNIFYAFATFMSFSILSQLNKNILTQLAYSCLAIGALGAYTVLASKGLVPDISAPSNFEKTTVSISGFTGLRTGWSNGIAYYASLAAYITATNKSKPIKFTSIFAIIAIFLSQLTVAGRAGMISTLFACSAILLMYGKKTTIITIGTITTIIFIIYLPQFAEHLRLNRIEGDIDLQSLNSFSAGRISSYLYALENIMNTPLTGIGFGNTDIRGHSVHNMFLRFTAETGIFFLIVFIAIITSAIRRCIRLRNIPAYPIIGIIIMQGFIMAQFEPNGILGTFQNSTLWWAALGLNAGLAIHFRAQKHQAADRHKRHAQPFSTL